MINIYHEKYIIITDNYAEICKLDYPLTRELAVHDKEKNKRETP